MPVLPSPLVFRFLQSLVKGMTAVGEDIWTPIAVKCLKGVACDNIWRVLHPVLEGRELIDDPTTPIPNAGAVSTGLGGSPTPNGASGVGSNEGDEEVASNGASGPSPPPRSATISTDWTLQLLFDALYLDEILHRRRKRR